MADAATRREARRKRILQNSSDRLQRIVQNRPGSPSHLNAERTFSFERKDSELPENIVETDESLPPSPFGPENETRTSERRVPLPDKRESYEDLRGRVVSGTRVEDPGKRGKVLRATLNVLLAVLLVARWTYENHTRQDVDLLIDIESFLWPFLGLQLFFLCFPSFRKVSHSGGISMLTVAIQLSGISIHITYTINFVLTSALAALTDLPFFLFGAVFAKETIDFIIPFVI